MKEKVFALQKDADKVQISWAPKWGNLEKSDTFHDLARTDNESSEKETDKASVEADSQESSSKSGKATKQNVLWQYCDIF